MTTSRSPYDEVTVSENTRSIRLVRLLRTSSADAIKCELQSFALDSCPLYTALSYTWGPVEPSYTITLGGIDFGVRENLWNFLGQMRSLAETRWFWIDAICIDQSNVAERNHQATQVTIWLGEATPERIRAIECIERVSEWPQYLFALIGDAAIPLEQFSWTPEQGDAVLALLSLPYWRRVWIVQEILIARQVVVRCGVRVLAWRQLAALGKMIRRVEEKDRARFLPGVDAMRTSAAADIMAARMFWGDLGMSSAQVDGGAGALRVLFFLLMQFPRQESTDVRDRIYGYLGLVESMAEQDAVNDPDSRDTQPSISVDYARSAAEVFTQCWSKAAPNWHADQFSKKLEMIKLLQEALRLSASDPAVQAAVSEADAAFLRWNLVDVKWTRRQIALASRYS